MMSKNKSVPLSRNLDNNSKEEKERERKWNDKKERASRDGVKPDDTSTVTGTGLSSPGEAVLSMGPSVWDGVSAFPAASMSYPVVGMNVIMDPNLMSMNNYGMMPSMVPEAPIISDQAMMMGQVKAIIHCKSCTLFPPNPGAPPPTTRDRPPGCRTVFVGGLPENITEETIGEVFDRCGEITTLRLSKKNFCHIRFLYEASVDAAIFLSGYRIRIGSNTDPPNTGRLHVDYAQARDDQYEWECKQRQLQREQRHRERMEEERLRPPSPPAVVHYSAHEAALVHDKIKQEESFTKAVQIVITWLERGDCNKHNVNGFYSMIQSTNSHVRRLLSEKTNHEEELKKAKEIMKGRMQGILLQFSHIERLFTAACHKKAWDHFTKAQRKNIEQWKKQSMEIKNIQLDEPQYDKDNDEMDVSDDDEPVKKKYKNDIAAAPENSLKEDNNKLKCQVEAYKNEVEVMKGEYKKDMEEKEQQVKLLQQTLQKIQQELAEARRDRSGENSSRTRGESSSSSSASQRRKQQDRPSLACTTSDRDVIDLDSENEQGPDQQHVVSPDSSSTPSQVLLASDARLVGIIATFLNVHPFGAGLDYIWSYVSKIMAGCRPSDIEVLMSKYPAVFKQELVGIGANIERRWMFIAFAKSC